MFASVKRIRADIAWLGRPFRAALFALAAIAILAGTFSWRIPPLDEVERWLYDLRNEINMSPVGQDRRILQVYYDDEILLTARQRNPLDRSILAKALTRLDTLGARGIAIDIMINQPTADDEELFAALRTLKTPTRIAYVNTRPAAHEIILIERLKFLEGMFETAANPNVTRANVDLDRDADGFIRRWPEASDPKIQSLVHFPLGDARDGLEFSGPIRFRRPKDAQREVYAKVGIDWFSDAARWDNPDVASSLGGLVRGRYILIGGRIEGINTHQTPVSRFSNAPVWGLDLLSAMLAQRLDGVVLRDFPRSVGFAICLSVLAAGFAIMASVATRARRALLFLFGIAALFGLGLAVDKLLGQSYGVNQLGWLIAWAAGGALASLVRQSARLERGRTATLALHRYLPVDIARSIVSQPERLGLNGERREIFALFTDLEGFTRLCHSVEPARMADFLNEYLEALSQVILEHGGTIDKFVGDAVVAFWGAPIAHPDDGQRAVRAALALYHRSEAFRGRFLGNGMDVGRTRIGLHYGPAIVGNFGGEGRIQYTALGDTMNVAARLEAANKQLGTSILISAEAYAHAGGLACIRRGKVTVRGRSTPLEIYEPSDALTEEEIERLNAFYESALRGDGEALAALAAWSETHPHDSGTAALLARLRDDADGVTRIA